MAKRGNECPSPDNHKKQDTEKDYEDDDDDKIEDVKEMFKSLKGMMKTMISDVRNDIKVVGGKVDDAKNMAREAKTEATSATAAAKEATSGLMDMQQGLNKLQVEVKELQNGASEKEQPKPMQKTIADNDDDDYGKLRQRQIIVSGFPKDTDAKEVMSTIEKFLAIDNRKSKVVEVSTFSDPTSIGVITLESVPSKIGFFKKIKGADAKIGEDKHMKFKDNKTLAERIIDRRLGMTKFYLMEHKGVKEPQKLIRIKWPLKEVQLRDSSGTWKKIAWFEEGIMQFCTEMKDVKTEVDKSMKIWFEERGLDESD